jgi:hypothetical protein
MSKRFVAFDLETAKILDDAPGDLLSHRPLGITCAVAIRSDAPGTPIVWHGRDAAGRPNASMSSAEAEALLAQLESFVDDGYSLATWNGLGFDFAVIADESGQLERSARLAERHVDMLFHSFCALGFRFGLQSAAEGMRLAGKTKGMSGAMAPVLWAEGRHDEVIDYCVQDTRTTLEIATMAEETRRLYWRARSGSRRELALPSGWLTVAEANALPLPDTSWMKDPPSREEFFRWFPGRETGRDHHVN